MTRYSAVRDGVNKSSDSRTQGHQDAVPAVCRQHHITSHHVPSPLLEVAGSGMPYISACPVVVNLTVLSCFSSDPAG
jgi:hypothetical protein